jgi:hypothetical protein
LQTRPQSPWRMYETAAVDALQKQRQTIWQSYQAGVVGADETTARLIRVGIALRRARSSNGLKSDIF